MLAIVLSLGVSLAYGLSNYAGPLQGRRHSTGTVLLVSQGAALVAAALVLAVSAEAAPGRGSVADAVVAGAANAAFLICFYEAVRAGGRLSVVVPIIAAGVALPVFYGIGHGDELHAATGLGLTCAVVGCMLAARESGDRRRQPSPRSRAWLAWTVAATLASGVFLIALPLAAEGGRWWALVNVRFVAVGMIVVWLVARRTTEWPPLRVVPALAVPGLLLLAGTLLYTLAAEQGALAVVSVLSSLAPVVTVTLAVVVLGERLGRPQRAGVALAVVGVALVAL